MPWVNFELDDELHRRAKSLASLNGENLYPFLADLIREGVERREAERAEQERKRRSR